MFRLVYPHDQFFPLLKEWCLTSHSKKVSPQNEKYMFCNNFLRKFKDSVFNMNIVANVISHSTTNLYPLKINQNQTQDFNLINEYLCFGSENDRHIFRFLLELIDFMNFTEVHTLFENNIFYKQWFCSYYMRRFECYWKLSKNQNRIELIDQFYKEIPENLKKFFTPKDQFINSNYPCVYLFAEENDLLAYIFEFLQKKYDITIHSECSILLNAI